MQRRSQRWRRGEPAVPIPMGTAEGLALAGEAVLLSRWQEGQRTEGLQLRAC